MLLNHFREISASENADANGFLTFWLASKLAGGVGLAGFSLGAGVRLARGGAGLALARQAAVRVEVDVVVLWRETGEKCFTVCTERAAVGLLKGGAGGTRTWPPWTGTQGTAVELNHATGSRVGRGLAVKVKRFALSSRKSF